MSLTIGRGPLAYEGAVFIEPHPRRVRGVIGERSVVHTEKAVLVHRVGSPLSYAFPAEEVGDLPSEPVAEAPGFVQVAWDAVDYWEEEGRRLVHYPPNPYHRVDCRPTDRRLRVEVAGDVLVDTAETVILFETGLPPVLYAERRHLLRDLEPSTSGRESYCNYKGTASYWSARIDDLLVEDVAWSYEDPLPESTPIRGLLAFDPVRVTLTAALPEGAR